MNSKQFIHFQYYCRSILGNPTFYLLSILLSWIKTSMPVVQRIGIREQLFVKSDDDDGGSSSYTCIIRDLVNDIVIVRRKIIDGKRPCTSGYVESRLLCEDVEKYLLTVFNLPSDQLPSRQNQVANQHHILLIFRQLIQTIHRRSQAFNQLPSIKSRCPTYCAACSASNHALTHSHLATIVSSSFATPSLSPSVSNSPPSLQTLEQSSSQPA